MFLSILQPHSETRHIMQAYTGNEKDFDRERFLHTGNCVKLGGGGEPGGGSKGRGRGRGGTWNRVIGFTRGPSCQRRLPRGGRRRVKAMPMSPPAPAQRTRTSSVGHGRRGECLASFDFRITK